MHRVSLKTGGRPSMFRKTGLGLLGLSQRQGRKSQGIVKEFVGSGASVAEARAKAGCETSIRPVHRRHRYAAAAARRFGAPPVDQGLRPAVEPRRAPAAGGGEDRAQSRLWPDTYVVDANLNVLIGEIRRVLEDSAKQPRFIRTVHGVGYAFCGTAADAKDDGEAGACASDGMLGRREGPHVPARGRGEHRRARSGVRGLAGFGQRLPPPRAHRRRQRGTARVARRSGQQERHAISVGARCASVSSWPTATRSCLARFASRCARGARHRRRDEAHPAPQTIAVG